MTDPIADIRILFAPLLKEAEGALTRREDQYPGLVEAGRMDQETAAREIDIWRAIVADWRNVVTGTGQKGSSATIEDKVSALQDSIDRYGPAILKSIANQSDTVRHECAEIKDRRYLAERHGKAVARYIELLECRDRLIDVRMVYECELPGARPWRGFWQSIDHYLEFHTRARTDREQRQAA